MAVQVSQNTYDQIDYQVRSLRQNVDDAYGQAASYTAQLADMQAIQDVLEVRPDVDPADDSSSDAGDPGVDPSVDPDAAA